MIIISRKARDELTPTGTNMKRTTKVTLATIYIATCGYMIHATSNVDSETGAPVHAIKANIKATHDTIQQLTTPPLCTEAHHDAPCTANGDNEPTLEYINGLPTCPTDLHLISFEDGSGGCYAKSDIDGRHPIISFDIDTFPWDCTTMGNKICGPR